MIDESLPSLLPYRNFFADGALDLRGNGVSVAYNLVGPSPESATIADIAACARQLAAAFVHLGTNDMVQMLFHRQPAPEPPPRAFPCRAAALVDAERRAQFAAESHWITLSRLYLTHQFEPPLKSWLKAALLAGKGPQRQARHELLREYALNRFAAFEDAAASAITLTRLTPDETFRDLLLAVTYHDYPAALPDPGV
jgi:type IV secretory pathway VirB4 component